MSEIKKTNDYSIFKKHPSNRELSAANVHKLKASLKAKNLLQYRPILIDADYRIIDGQHRLEAAKELGIDVWYQVQDSGNAEDIILINANQKKWNRDDYMNFFISKGNIEYLKVKEYCEKNKIGLSSFLRIAPNYCSRGGRVVDKFISGTYKFPIDEQLQLLALVTDHMKIVREHLDNLMITKRDFINHSMFEKALILFLRTPEFELKTFLNKLEYKIQSLRPCTQVEAYIQLFKDIYNWRNANALE